MQRFILREKQIFIRKWNKFSRDPEHFFRDSRKPLLQAIGRFLVLQRRATASLIPCRTTGSATAPVHAGVAPPNISVIVPIFNAPEALEKCLESVVRHTTLPYRLVLLDDASTDDRIEKILDTCRNREHILIERNPANIGYTKTINRGIALTGTDDVVLLNSDTRVGPRWLQNLFIAACQDDRIATVTPLSNNAGAFSAPLRCGFNELPEGLSFTEVSRLVNQHSLGIYAETPTGNGFCLYIRRKALDEVGGFDADTFPRGYGEENDWCQRAIGSGWRHVIDDRTYIFHQQAASFGPERESLLRKGRKHLDARYPGYSGQVKAFLNSGEMAEITNSMHTLFTAGASGRPPVRPRILFVISSETGGTPQTNADLMQALRTWCDPCLLISDSRTIRLKDCSGAKPKLLEQVKLSEPIRAGEHTSPEYDRLIGQFLIKYAIELVHIRHLSWHSLNLPAVAKCLGIPVVLSFHDYYMVCPNTQLLDENLAYCGGRCTASPGDCRAQLWDKNEKPELKHRWVHEWRGKMTRVFADCSAFVTTSRTARNVFTAVYPELDEKEFAVIPHGRHFEQIRTPAVTSRNSGKVRLLFPGNLSFHKGLDLINRLKESDREDLFEIHTLGKLSFNGNFRLHPKIIVHGPYRRSEFHVQVDRIKPDFIGIFSIWPETFCHTVLEAWSVGVPIITTGWGAIGEHIANWGGGWVIDATDADRMFREVKAISDSPREQELKKKEIRVWQHHCRSTVTEMASNYRRLYEKFISHSYE